MAFLDLYASLSCNVFSKACVSVNMLNAHVRVRMLENRGEENHEMGARLFDFGEEFVASVSALVHFDGF